MLKTVVKILTGLYRSVAFSFLGLSQAKGAENQVYLPQIQAYLPMVNHCICYENDLWDYSCNGRQAGRLTAMAGANATEVFTGWQMDCFYGRPGRSANIYVIQQMAGISGSLPGTKVLRQQRAGHG